MEVNVVLNISDREMKNLFNWDDVLFIRYYDRIKYSLYDIMIEIPECNIYDSDIPKTLKELKDEVIKECPGDFRFCSNIYFSNEDIILMYGESNYSIEKKAKEYARLKDTEIEKIEPIERIIKLEPPAF